MENTSSCPNCIFIEDISLMLLSPPLQDPCQSGLQQHCHSGGSQEKRLFTKLGETAFKEQRHSTTELTAAANSCHERIAEAEALCWNVVS